MTAKTVKRIAELKETIETITKLGIVKKSLYRRLKRSVRELAILEQAEK
jgi:hypothetical protein